MMTMKKIFLGVFIGVIWSLCTKNEKIQIMPNKNLQYVIDTIISSNKIEKATYELFIDKVPEYRCDMVLHIGIEPYYNDSVFCLSYLVSNECKINIYSGVESYFNLPGKQIGYGKSNGIRQNKDHLLWIIHMYMDSIIDVYSANYVNPFLIIPASPKYFIYPDIIE
jgi:hypothetical protein